jgi:two-component sensor histidine kinase
MLVAMGNNMLEELHTPEELAQIHEQLWRCVLQFGNVAAVQERNRIARDLHDSLGHALIALNIQLQSANKLWKLDPTQAQQFLAEAQRLGAIAVKEVRQSVNALRDDAAETQSLEPLVESLTKDFYQTTGVLPSTYIDLPVALPSQIVTPLYRIIQEALNNIRKYAQATEVQIHISAMPTIAYLLIQDNGRGFKPEEATGGFGLQGMRERVAVLRGQFHLESEPGAGCRIMVELPFQFSPCEQKPLETDETIKLSVQQLCDEQELPDEVGQTMEDENKWKSLESYTQISTPPIEYQPCLVLSSTQISGLETLLAEIVGPLASKLLQWFLSRATSLEDLIEDVVQHLPVSKQLSFKHQATVLLQDRTVQPESVPRANHSAIAKDFVQRCEQALADLVGPIASLLVHKILITSPQISNQELVETLAAKIPKPEIALQFKKRLLGG